MDTNKIKQIFELFNNSDVTEFNYEDENVKFILKKSPAAPLEHNTQPHVVYKEVPDQDSNLPPQNSTVAAVNSPEKNVHIITSPLVGTMYISSNPTSEQFVRVGSKVKKGQTVCIVEAMKVMNEIESDVDGEIIEVLVANANPVEFETPLFKVKTA